MIVAGSDIATTTGIAIFDGDRLIHAEAHRPKGKTDPEIFHGFRVWFRSLLISHGVQHCAIEEPLRSDIRKRNPDGTEQAITSMATYLRLYGLRGHALEVCHSLNIPCEEYNQSSWRKTFIGNGRASKDDSVKRCKQLGYDIKSKDACEAVGVAYHLMAKLQEQTLFDRIAKSAA